MSPEQLNGLGSDPQSDQFSFCIALFEALAGYRPFIDDNLVDLIKRTLDGEQRPPPPSTRVPGGVWRALRRGLSAEPDHRFRSMSELCAELDRQLRPAWRRWWALAGVGVGLASATGGAAIYRHYQQTTCTEDATEASRIWDAKRDGVRDGLLAAPAVFAKATWQQVERDLEQWTAAWQAERVDVCAATDAPAADRTRRVLCLEEQVRELDGLLSVLSTPDPVVTEHASRAVAGLGQPERCVDTQWLAATQPVPPDAAIQADVDAARATLARARALSRTGKDALALDVAREQSELAAALDYAPLIAEASLSVGRASLGLGDYKTAEAALVQAVAQANAAGAPRTGAQASIELLSLVGAHLERFEEGRTWSRLAAGYIQRLGPAGRDLDARRLVSLAQVESRGRNPDETLRLLDEARALMSEIDASQMQWVSLWTIEATARTALGESATALELRERVARANEELYGAAHPSVAMARLNLGIAKARRGDFDGARAKLQSALELNAAAYGEDHPDNARILNNLANVAVLTGKTDEAEDLQLEAIALNRRAYGPNDKRLLRNLANLGLIQLRQGRTDEAEATLHSVVEGYEALSGPDHLDVAEALLNLSTVSSEKQDLDRAYSLLLRAKSIFDEHSPTVPGRGATLHNLANVTRSLGEPEQALSFAREAVELVQASHGPSNPEWAKARSLLALLLLETGDVEGTRELMDTLLPWASSEAVDADTAATISFIHADLLWTAGDQEGARAAARRGLEAALPGSPVAAALSGWLDAHP